MQASKESLTYGRPLVDWKIRSRFDSFSVKSGTGAIGLASKARRKRPRLSCSAEKNPSASEAMTGFFQYPSPVRPQDQVLRNQRVGRTSRRAGSGPRLATVMRIRTSSGDALAYSAKTSK